MSSQQYVRGEFQRFRALTKISIGKAQTDVYKDEIIEFDGTTVKIAGDSHVDSAIRGAIAAGWFVPEDDNISQYVAKRADIKLRPALNAGGKPTEESVVTELTDEEREVSTLAGSNARRMAAADPQQNRRTAASDDKDAEIARLKAMLAGPAAKPVDPRDAEIAKLKAQLAAKQGGSTATVTVTDDYSDLSDYTDESGQGGVPVSRIKSAAVTSFKADESSISAAARKLQTDGQPLNVERLRVDPTRVAKSVRLSAESASGDVRESREALDVEDLLPDAIKGKPKTKTGVINTEGEDNASATLVFVTSSKGTKIPWDKANHWRVRVKTLLDKYGNDPDTVKAILAIEDKGVISEYERMVAKRA